jgi:amylosucrase
LLNYFNSLNRKEVYDPALQQKITHQLQANEIGQDHYDQIFVGRLSANIAFIKNLYDELYGQHVHASQYFDRLVQHMMQAHQQRSIALREKDEAKAALGQWFLSNEITGMSLYVDRFAGNLKNMPAKLPYFQSLGVNFLHLMPIFQSPAGESDGGYAVSDFRTVDERFGHLADLKALQEKMQEKNMYLMLDIVLNHTSHQHEWAKKAKQGDQQYQDFYYLYDARKLPDAFEKSMPEIFPEAAPGSFTYVEELKKWAMTVFHHYQWDLNFTNPAVFCAMLDTIFFYANLGVDILRIDAPAFIWKKLGTSCQNLPEAHTLLRLIKLCVQAATPGMALLGEAIVAPKEILKYFGTGAFTARECDFAYNATHMALQWDALATGDTRVMLAAQHEILQKPYGTSWITYTRCHDDIGLGYDDYMIQQSGYEPFAHRNYIKNYYSGNHTYSMASGALFSSNPKTGDARISGSLASLCGLERALEANNASAIDEAINKIVLMQAHSFFLGGVPMLFYGDELAYTNDYSYLEDPGKSYDNRWMHRPNMHAEKNKLAQTAGSPENRVFTATQQLIAIRRKLSVLADTKNLTWLTPHNIHIAGYLRSNESTKLYCLFNFSKQDAYLTWFAFKEHGLKPAQLYDHWSQKNLAVGDDREYLIMAPYQIMILEAK